jgi:hypothetical protein
MRPRTGNQNRQGRVQGIEKAHKRVSGFAVQGKHRTLSAVAKTQMKGDFGYFETLINERFSSLNQKFDKLDLSISESAKTTQRLAERVEKHNITIRLLTISVAVLALVLLSYISGMKLPIDKLLLLAI